ncbi:glycosyltransferase family 39 protein [Candidatus Leptofilum sp.]|uniref:glycosyltransferase family 39 protein n=1 Tax=Candidatus Leptofilum sp. TaxID=3241576 RepID=UPI003B5CCE28
MFAVNQTGVKSNLFTSRRSNLADPWRVIFLLILLTSFLLIANYFEYFPNGWDQTEYARGLKQNYLPHSPYILYFLLGKLFYWLIGDAAVALSTLSFASGLIALTLLFVIIKHFYQRQPTIIRTVAASIATLLLGINYLFVRQAGTQEIYIVQLCFLLLTASLLLKPKRDRTILAGLAYGGAIAVHNSSIFLLPALLFILLSQPNQDTVVRRKGGLKFTVVTLGAVILFSALIYLLIPKNYHNHHLFYFDYLRGIAPTVKLSRLLDPFFLQQSAQQLFVRLTAQDIPHGRMPLATFPTGLPWTHVLMALAGMALTWRLNWRTAVFWLLWMVPYLSYELLLGNTPDFGVYVVFFLPGMLAAVGILIAWAITKTWRASRQNTLITAIISLMLIFYFWLPSLQQFGQHWDDVAQDAIAQYSPSRLAALALVNHLPDNAVVIQSSEEWNVNALPFYMPYRPVVRDGGYLLLYNGQGPFTPMTYAYYQILTTEKLKELLAMDIPVYAFEPDPLQNFSNEMIEQDAFHWQAALWLNLQSVHKQVNLPEALKQELPDGEFQIYRASLATTP